MRQVIEQGTCSEPVQPRRRALAALGLAGLAGLTGLTGLLSGCVTPRIVGQVGADTFVRAGRFALRVEAPGAPAQAVQGGFVWRDDGQQLRLDLTNPLGTILAQVDLNARQAVLTRADGSQTVAANADSLLAEVFGSVLPVAGLRHWLQGRQGAASVQSAAQTVAQPAAQAAALTEFSEDGWRVRLSRYDALGPRLLHAQRWAPGTQERIDVRLVIDGNG